MATVARKVDKWKLKKKYRILLPENFGGKDTGLIAFGNDKNMIGRTILLSLRDINGDKQKQHINIELRVKEVEGDKAKTVFNRMIVDRKYIWSRVQVGKTVIDQRYDFFVKDAKVISKINILTVYRIRRSQKHDIILKIPKILERYKDMEFYKFLDYVLAGNVNIEIFRELKKIVPIQRVEIREIKPVEISEIKKETSEEKIEGVPEIQTENIAKA
ncbi:MAG: hypothetical protein ACK4YO_01270 [Candidatus Altarchaeaceae archaeon]